MMALVIRPLKHSSSNNNNDDNKSNNYKLLHAYRVSGTVLSALNGLSLNRHQKPVRYHYHLYFTDRKS